MSTTNESGSTSSLPRQFARASVVAPVIAWVLALCFSQPDAHLVPAKVIADFVRTGFFVGGVVLGVIALVEVGRRGTRGILVAALVGLVFNSLGLVGAYRNLPDEIRMYRAGRLAEELRTASAELDFQNLANPNLLRTKANLEAQRARVDLFLTTARRCTLAMESARDALASRTSPSDPAIGQITQVIQSINGKLELCRREATLAETARGILDLLISECGRWQMPAGARDPSFEVAEAAQTYKTLDNAMFAAEQALAGAQGQILGQSLIHPGERTVSITTFNQPLPVHARALVPVTAVSVSTAPAPTPATVPVIVEYGKLDLENPAGAATAASAAVRSFTGEDALVLQAWSGVLSNLVATSDEVTRTARALGTADVLNGATIVKQGPVSTSDQFVARRRMANAFGTAVQAWRQRVSGLDGQYLAELYRNNVSSGRGQVERTRLAEAVADKVKLQLKICDTEQEIALGYNRAISTLETYQQYQRASPSPAPSVGGNSAIPARPIRMEQPADSNPGASQYAKQLSDQQAKLMELQRSLQQMRK